LNDQKYQRSLSDFLYCEKEFDGLKNDFIRLNVQAVHDSSWIKGCYSGKREQELKAGLINGLSYFIGFEFRCRCYYMEFIK
jgi:hypothetical protein